MLTGDKKEAGEEAAKELGIDEVYTELLPGDKVELVEQLLDEMSGSGEKEQNLPLSGTVSMMLRFLEGQMWELPWEAWDQMRPLRRRTLS